MFISKASATQIIISCKKYICSLIESKGKKANIFSYGPLMKTYMTIIIIGYFDEIKTSKLDKLYKYMELLNVKLTDNERSKIIINSLDSYKVIKSKLLTLFDNSDIDNIMSTLCIYLNSIANDAIEISNYMKKYDSKNYLTKIIVLYEFGYISDYLYKFIKKTGNTLEEEKIHIDETENIEQIEETIKDVKLEQPSKSQLISTSNLFSDDIFTEFA